MSPNLQNIQQRSSIINSFWRPEQAERKPVTTYACCYDIYLVLRSKPSIIKVEKIHKLDWLFGSNLGLCTN